MEQMGVAPSGQVHGETLSPEVVTVTSVNGLPSRSVSDPTPGMLTPRSSPFTRLLTSSMTAASRLTGSSIRAVVTTRTSLSERPPSTKQNSLCEGKSDSRTATVASIHRHTSTSRSMSAPTRPSPATSRPALSKRLARLSYIARCAEPVEAYSTTVLRVTTAKTVASTSVPSGASAGQVACVPTSRLTSSGTLTSWARTAGAATAKARATDERNVLDSMLKVAKSDKRWEGSIE